MYSEDFVRGYYETIEKWAATPAPAPAGAVAPKPPVAPKKPMSGAQAPSTKVDPRAAAGMVPTPPKSPFGG